MKEDKFYADSMLGKLARWLRLMGFSVEYATPDLSDDEIMKYCREKGLFLITRDKELSARYQDSIYMESDSYEEQLKAFTSKFRPSQELYFTRCPLCNGSVRKMKTADFEGDLPEGIRLRQRHIYACEKCGKAYWEGSHFDAILKKINGIMNEGQS